MRQFDVFVENRTSAIADLCELLAKNAVNIKSITTDGYGASRIVKLVTEDERTTKNLLTQARAKFTESEILAVKLIDRPGELAKVLKILSKERIAVDSIYILGKENDKTVVAIKADNIEKAKKLLK